MLKKQGQIQGVTFFGIRPVFSANLLDGPMASHLLINYERKDSFQKKK